MTCDPKPPWDPDWAPRNTFASGDEPLPVFTVHSVEVLLANSYHWCLVEADLQDRMEAFNCETPMDGFQVEAQEHFIRDLSRRVDERMDRSILFGEKI